MRILSCLTLSAIFLIGCSKPEKTVDYRPPISAAVEVLKGELMGTNYFALIHHPATHTLFNSTPAWTSVDFPKSMNNLANYMGSVDVTQCPEDFRLAWVKVVHTLENYQIGPDAPHSLASGAAGVVAMKTGSKEAGDLAAREFEEITTKNDIKLAVQDLETVCMKYGVQPSLLKASQRPVN